MTIDINRLNRNALSYSVCVDDKNSVVGACVKPLGRVTHVAWEICLTPVHCISSDHKF
jgi:hypothetical protein